jgi:hypothetical protein
MRKGGHRETCVGDTEPTFFLGHDCSCCVYSNPACLRLGSISCHLDPMFDNQPVNGSHVRWYDPDFGAHAIRTLVAGANRKAI